MNKKKRKGISFFAFFLLFRKECGNFGTLGPFFFP